MKRRRQPFIAGVSLLEFLAGWFLATGIIFAQTDESISEAQKPGSFRLKISDGHLTVDANDAPLAKILEELGRQARIDVESNIGPAETVSMRLEKAPLEEGIKRLFRNVTIHYGKTPNEKGHRIARIIALSEVKTKITRSGEGSAEKTSQERKPANRPKPFAFEFDPSKSISKEQKTK